MTVLVAGRVLGPTIEPQVGVVVEAAVVNPGNESWQDPRRAVTDGKGHFVVELRDVPRTAGRAAGLASGLPGPSGPA